MHPPIPGPWIALDLRLEPQPLSLRLVRGQMRSLMGDFGFTVAQVEAVLLGLDEVLTNAFFHGQANSRREPIEMRVELFSDRLTIEVADRGLVASKLKSRAAELPDEESESGRGLYLIRQTMDEVHYESREGGGTRVRLVKRRH